MVKKTISYRKPTTRRIGTPAQPRFVTVKGSRVKINRGSRKKK